MKKTYPPLLCCAVASEFALFKNYRVMDQDDVDRAWTYTKYAPAITTIKNKISRNNIKWYIHNFIDVEDKVWNGDFVAGISTFGKVHWSKLFPIFHWKNHSGLIDIVQSSPFSGELVYNTRNRNSWSGVPAFCLKSSEDSISFMAGVLATGRELKRNGKIYAKYNKPASKYLEAWGIPIEYQTDNKVVNLISPLWPALLSDHMPECCNAWRDIHRGGCMSEIYSPILWRMYVANHIVTNGLPYLKSRRWIYDHYGTVKNLEGLWLKYGLSQLDNRIITVVKSLAKDV